MITKIPKLFCAIFIVTMALVIFVAGVSYLGSQVWDWTHQGVEAVEEFFTNLGETDE